MSKKKKLKSFAGRLTWRIVMATLVTLGIMSFAIISMAMIVLDMEATEKYRQSLECSNQMVRRMLSDIYVATQNNVDDIEASLDSPDKIAERMVRMVRLNPYMRSCSMAFIADYYPAKGRLYQPTAVRTDSTNAELRPTQGQGRDYTKEKWFAEALKADKGYWSEPFMDAKDTTAVLVAFLQPIRDAQGRTVAVLSADLSLNWLSHRLYKEDISVMQKMWGYSDDEIRRRQEKAARDTTGKSPMKVLSHTFIVNHRGTYLIHSDSTMIGRANIADFASATPDTVDDRIVRDMLAGKENKEDYEESLVTINDKEFTVLYQPIKHVNWSLGMLVPTLSIKIMGYALALVMSVLIVVLTLVLFLVSRRLIRRTAKPLTQLAMSADEVAKGNFNTPLPTIKHKDEIGMLRDSFEKMQESLTLYIDELKITTAEKVAIDSELRVAHDIQMSMLPKTFPAFPERHDVDIYGTLTPAKAVGGDLFDFYIRDEHLYFCIGDVSGKGVPAALVMAVTRSLFRNVAEQQKEPHHIVRSMNDILTENNDNNMFVTVFVGVLNLQTGLLLYCNAGHEAPMLLGRKVGILPCDPNLPVGVEKGWQFTLQKETIDEKTTIFLYTDGLNEAENASHEQMGEERVDKVCNEALSEQQHTPVALIERMVAAVHDFVGDAEQSDDLTMLAIQYKGNINIKKK